MIDSGNIGSYLGSSGAGGVGNLTLSPSSISMLAGSLSQSITGAFRQILPTIMSYVSNTMAAVNGVNRFTSGAFLNAALPTGALRGGGQLAFATGAVNHNAYMMNYAESFGFRPGEFKTPGQAYQFLSRVPGGLAMMQSNLRTSAELVGGRFGINPMAVMGTIGESQRNKAVAFAAKDVVEHVRGLNNNDYAKLFGDTDRSSLTNVAKIEERFSKLDPEKDKAIMKSDAYQKLFNKLRDVKAVRGGDFKVQQEVLDRAEEAEVARIYEAENPNQKFKALTLDQKRIAFGTHRFEQLSDTELAFGAVTSTNMAFNRALSGKFSGDTGSDAVTADRANQGIKTLIGYAGNRDMAENIARQAFSSLTQADFKEGGRVWQLAAQSDNVQKLTDDTERKNMTASIVANLQSHYANGDRELAVANLVGLQTEASRRGSKSDPFGLARGAELAQRTLIAAGGDVGRAQLLTDTINAMTGDLNMTASGEEIDQAKADLVEVAKHLVDGEKGLARIFDQVSGTFSQLGLATKTVTGKQSKFLSIMSRNVAKAQDGMQTSGVDAATASVVANEALNDVLGSRGGEELGSVIGMIGSMQNGKALLAKHGAAIQNLGSMEELRAYLSSHSDLAGAYSVWRNASPAQKKFFQSQALVKGLFDTSIHVQNAAEEAWFLGEDGSRPIDTLLAVADLAGNKEDPGNLRGEAASQFFKDVGLNLGKLSRNERIRLSRLGNFNDKAVQDQAREAGLNEYTGLEVAKDLGDGNLSQIKAGYTKSDAAPALTGNMSALAPVTEMPAELTDDEKKDPAKVNAYNAKMAAYYTGLTTNTSDDPAVRALTESVHSYFAEFNSVIESATAKVKQITDMANAVTGAEGDGKFSNAAGIVTEVANLLLSACKNLEQTTGDMATQAAMGAEQ